MATRTRTTNRVAAAKTVTYPSKSAHARALFSAGRSVVEVMKTLDIGYAFAYGIAKRAGVASTAANRRPTRAVAIDPVTKAVVIQTTIGPVSVFPDGRVVMPKPAPKTRFPKAPKAVTTTPA